MSATDPYRDPGLYDLEYAGMTEDVEHYVSLASRARGPVLELGCGNGRLAIPIARSGVVLHGIDRSETMLDDFERKLASESGGVAERIELESGDFREIPDRGVRYPLVMLPFNALHHCVGPADVRKLLASVRRVLRPDGCFALDCYLPDPILYARDPEVRHEERTFIDPRTGERLDSWEQGWWDETQRVHHVVYVYERAGGERDEIHLELNMFERPELLALFKEAGFAVGWEASDFRGSRMGPGALKWVMELRPVRR